MSLRPHVVPALAICALVTVLGCRRSAADAGEPSSAPPVTAAPPAPASLPAAATACTLVFLKTGPQSGKLPEERNAELFQGHFTNMQRLADERKLLVAGPFGRTRHDEGLRGVFVLATGTRSEAESWASTDPPTQAGIFVMEYHDLVTDAPLRRAADEHRKWRAEQEAAGKKPEPAASLRTYVLMTAADGDAAFRELGPLRSAEGGVFLLGRLDGTKALALLDADSVDAARTRFGAKLGAIGAVDLDEWLASLQLARLNELRAD